MRICKKYIILSNRQIKLKLFLDIRVLFRCKVKVKSVLHPGYIGPLSALEREVFVRFALSAFLGYLLIGQAIILMSEYLKSVHLPAIQTFLFKWQSFYH